MCALEYTAAYLRQLPPFTCGGTERCGAFGLKILLVTDEAFSHAPSALMFRPAMLSDVYGAPRGNVPEIFGEKQDFRDRLVKHVVARRRKFALMRQQAEKPPAVADCNRRAEGTQVGTARRRHRIDSELQTPFLCRQTRFLREGDERRQQDDGKNRR
jgi:hypothetical protein